MASLPSFLGIATGWVEISDGQTECSRTGLDREQNSVPLPRSIADKSPINIMEKKIASYSRLRQEHYDAFAQIDR